MFQPRASLREMISLCRNVGVALHAGISIIKAFELASRKAQGGLHAVLEDVIRDLKAGSDVTGALERHAAFLPDLFIDMVQVGDATGSLPEVLKALADHYDNNLRLRRDFLGQITLPVIQLLAAIFIVAGLICLLGWVASMTGHAVDVLGWGLLGTRGALIWLGGWTMLAVSGVVAYKFVTTSLSGQKAIHRLLLSIPVVGSTLRNFAIARFSWAFHLTQNAGMPIDDSLEASLRATSNGAFLAAAPDIIAEITEGATLTDALDHTHLFPVEFIEYVMVAEQTGTVPEALDRLSPQFEENARRSLQALAAALSWLVWAGVAAFIIFIIFTVVFWYLRMLDDAMKGF